MDTAQNPDQNPQAPAQAQEPSSPMQPKRGGRAGLAFSVLILAAVIVLGALYFWGMSVSDRQAAESGADGDDTRGGASADAETDAIERDIDGSGIDDSDKELEDIDTVF